MEKLRNELVVARYASRLTQKDMGERMGVSTVTANAVERELERGMGNVGDEMLLAYVNALPDSAYKAKAAKAVERELKRRADAKLSRLGREGR